MSALLPQDFYQMQQGYLLPAVLEKTPLGIMRFTGYRVECVAAIPTLAPLLIL